MTVPTPRRRQRARAPWGWTGTLDLRKEDPRSRRLTVINQLEYRCRADGPGRGRAIVIPAGWRTDLASIPDWLPRFLQHWLGGKIKSAYAAVLHDWLYRCGLLPKSVADALLREALELEGDDSWRWWTARWLYWAGPAVGGWLPWWRGRREGS